jgi:hypothetical protein
MAPSIPLERADGAIGTLEQPLDFPALGDTRLVAATIRSASPGITGIPPVAATHDRRTQPEWRRGIEPDRHATSTRTNQRLVVHHT